MRTLKTQSTNKMRIVRSFDDFVGATRLNEAEDKFKMDVENPSTGEVAKFRLVMREFDPKASLPQLVIQQAVSKPEFSKFSNDTSLIAFMKIDKMRDSGFLQARDLLKAVVIFKKKEGYDTAKGTPLATVGSFKVYNADDAQNMNAGDKTTKADAEKEIKMKTDIDFTPTADKQQNDPAKPNPVAKSEWDEVKDVTPNGDVLSYLKDKLLNGVNVKFKKSSNKVSEIKFVQIVISKLTRTDGKTLTAAAEKIKASGIDGIYGSGTATAFGLMSNEPNVPKDSLDDVVVKNLARWCTLNQISKSNLETIFAETKKTTVTTTVKPDSGDKKQDKDKKNYYFVNAPKE